MHSSDDRFTALLAYIRNTCRQSWSSSEIYTMSFTLIVSAFNKQKKNHFIRSLRTPTLYEESSDIHQNYVDEKYMYNTAFVIITVYVGVSPFKYSRHAHLLRHKTRGLIHKKKRMYIHHRGII